jgi:hypothetical protein
MHIPHATPAYQRALHMFLFKGIPLERALDYCQKNDRPTTHYIWRTRGDNSVRGRHAANNGRIFAWDSPPPTGHPSEDYGCRCIAEPYYPDASEYVEQTIISTISDGTKWTDRDMVKHFYFGNGRGVRLSEIGYLSDVIHHYFHAEGAMDRINAQIIDEARNHDDGPFGYFFDRSYKFRPVLYSLGDGVVAGVFTGTLRTTNGMMHIEGSIDYAYRDVFTDIVSARERFDAIIEYLEFDPFNTTPEELNAIERIAELGGTFFPVYDDWKTAFRASAYHDKS